MSKSTIGTILIVAFIICLLFSAFFLFSFQSELIYKYKVVNPSEIEKASRAFYDLYVVVIFTLLLGLTALLFTRKFNQTEIVYVERNEEKKKIRNRTGNEKNIEFNMSFYDKIDPSLSLEKKIEKGFNRVCEDLKAGQGVLYMAEGTGEKQKFIIKSGYALNSLEERQKEFLPGEGIVGQVAKDGKLLSITDVPSNYIKIISGLGNTSPNSLILAPIIHKEKVVGIVELALFASLGKSEKDYLQHILNIFGSWFLKVEKPQTQKKNGPKKQTFPSSK